MKNHKRLFSIVIPILIFIIVVLSIYYWKFLKQEKPSINNLPEIKVKNPNYSQSENLPPLPPPSSNEKKDPVISSISIIVKNDRSIVINQERLEMHLLNQFLHDLYLNREDKSIRIIAEDNAFRDDVLRVRDTVRKLNLQIETIENFDEALKEAKVNKIEEEDISSFKIEGGIEGGVEGGVTGNITGKTEGTKINEGSEKVIRFASSQRPNKIKDVKPIYPQNALEAKIQAVVILEIEIDKMGSVKNTRVISGHPLLNEAAIDAVKQWEYEPYKSEGKANPAIFTVTVTFTLQGK